MTNGGDSSQKATCNVARPATLTLALTFCLSRVHVITEPSPKTQVKKKKR